MPQNLSNTDSVLAIIVLYKTHLNESLTLNSLIAALAKAKKKIDLFIYDNSPNAISQTALSRLQEFFMNVKYINDPTNPGVSKAYNEGGRYAKTINKKWLLLLDQDTQIDPFFFINLNKSISIYSNESLFVPVLKQNNLILSPCKYFFKNGWPIKEIAVGKQDFKKRNFLNSGVVVSTELFEKVAGYDERVTLYFSDFVFFEKVAKVLDSYVVIDSVFVHSMSSNDTTNLHEFYSRFELYCKGIKQAMTLNTVGGKILYLTLALLRSFKLSVKFKSEKFIKICNKTFFDETSH